MICHFAPILSTGKFVLNKNQRRS